jgi:signal peptidase II
VVVLDQLTKLWAVAALSDRPVDVVDDVLRLRLTRNPGGAFSLLTGFTPLLALLAAAMAVVIVRTTRRATDRVMAYSLALVLGGAVGNLIDRLARAPGFLRGEVVDFIKLPYWPTFNLADSAITIGVAVIVLRGWRSS